MTDEQQAPAPEAPALRPTPEELVGRLIRGMEESASVPEFVAARDAVLERLRWADEVEKGLTGAHLVVWGPDGVPHITPVLDKAAVVEREALLAECDGLHENGGEDEAYRKIRAAFMALHVEAII